MPRDLRSVRYWAHRIVPVLDNIEVVTLGGLKPIDPTIPQESYEGNVTYIAHADTPLCFDPEDLDDEPADGRDADRSPQFDLPIEEIARGAEMPLTAAQDAYTHEYDQLAALKQPRLNTATASRAAAFADRPHTVRPSGSILADIETQYAAHSLKETPPPAEQPSKSFRRVPL